jgi:hypothetical protein
MDSSGSVEFLQVKPSWLLMRSTKLVGISECRGTGADLRLAGLKYIS